MAILKKLNYILVISMLITVMPACSSGGGDDDPPAVNDTTWDELVWDDGTVDRTRNWAD